MPFWLAVILGVLGGLATLSALVLVATGAVKGGKITDLRADNDDLRKRDGDRVLEIAELKLTQDGLETRVGSLEQEKTMLLAVVTQATEMTALTVSVTKILKILEKKPDDA